MRILTRGIRTTMFVFILETSRTTFVLEPQIHEYLYQGIREIL